ncbi:MAG: TrkA family potassium uptake protein [Eubacteriales bacterium]|nr:TrkA family potassium uptake protein [Eubacteriales bacterium]
MNIIIMGAGRLARHLAMTLYENGHQINMIESSFEAAEKFASEMEGIRVIHGDGTDLATLRKANIQETDCYIALSGLDEDNLIGCQIAKQVFRVRRCCARVNHPRNRHVYEQVGIDLVYSSTDIMVDLIEQDIDFDGMRILYNIPGTAENIVELRLSPNSKAVGKALMDYTFPGNSRVVLLSREDGAKTEVPVGSTVMAANDRMLVICVEAEYNDLYKKLVKP